MTQSATIPLSVKWRIVELDLRDLDCLGMIGLAHISFDKEGLGEFSFGRVVLIAATAQTPSTLTWQSHEEMGEPAIADRPNSVTTAR